MQRYVLGYRLQAFSFVGVSGRKRRMIELVHRDRWIVRSWSVVRFL